MKEPTVTFEDNYVHIRHPKGDVFSPESTHCTLHRAFDLCALTRCRRILEEAEAPVRRQDPESVAAMIGGFSLLSGLKLARCFYGYQTDSLSEHLVNVAASHGLTLRFFGDRDEALQWLGAK